MNEQETTALVGYLIANDPNLHRTMGVDTVRLRIHAWSAHLAEVPFEWARRYSLRQIADTGRTAEVGVGEIKNAWDREAARAEGPAAVVDDLLGEAPPWVRPYYDRCKVAADAMRARGVVYESPEWIRTMDAVPTGRPA